MPPSNHLQHRRTHNLLLVSKLLSCKDSASPFTLAIDSLEQSCKPLTSEFIRRANSAKTRVIYASFEALRKPKGVDVFVDASRQAPAALHKEISAHVAQANNQRTLLVIDTLHPLIATAPNLPHFLSSLITPTTALLCVYHSDIPLATNASPTSSFSPYSPHPLSLLSYLATTIINVHSFSHLLQQKAASERSLPHPAFGLHEEKEGALVGLGSNDTRGIVLQLEYRRKSGRGVREMYFLPSLSHRAPSTGPDRQGLKANKERIILLEDHPLYQPAKSDEPEGEEEMSSTFNLGLTEKQRRDREGVVLPYFDAQKEDGVGQGGRILYDMGSEDDFDEEEDEI